MRIYQFQVRIFFFFKQKSFLPFLWQVAEFSLVCEEGRREVCLFWGLLCTCRSFTTFYKLSQQRKRERDLKEGKKKGKDRVGICRMYLWEKKRKEKEGWRRVDEEMALITRRSGHYQRDSIKQKQMETISQSISNKLQQPAGWWETHLLTIRAGRLKRYKRNLVKIYIQFPLLMNRCFW